MPGGNKSRKGYHDLLQSLHPFGVGNHILPSIIVLPLRVCKTQMKLISCLLSLIFIVSCSSSQTAVPVVEIISTTQPSPTPTITSLPPAVTTVPTIAPTDTAIPCETFTADFCITDGYFLLQRPIHPPANDSVDRIYPYASTADGTRDPHRGVEFVNEFGTPVYAAGEGVVIFAGPDDEAIYSPWQIYYGNLVVIQHNDELFTLYAHLSKIEVDGGDVVQAGDQIGEVGSTGAAIGSHLHFEVRRGEVEDYFSMENPELWLLPSQFDFGAMEISIINATSQFQKAAFTIQRINDSNDVLVTYYVGTYHPTLALGSENAAIGDLPAGKYRITLIFNGYLYERWVEVQSSKLTQVVIVVK